LDEEVGWRRYVFAMSHKVGTGVVHVVQSDTKGQGQGLGRNISSLQ